MQRILRLFFVSLTLIFVVTGVQAKNGGGKANSTHERIVLRPTSQNTSGSGFAEIFLKAKRKRTDQSFQLQVNKLPANTGFMLIVDGKTVDTFTSNSGGTFETVFSNNSKGSHRPLPSILDPVTKIKHVEIKAASGQPLVSGTFGDEGEMEKEIALSSTGVIPNARGEAKIEIERDDEGDDGEGDGEGDDEDGGGQGETKQSFELEVENLTASTNFILFVDGNQVSTFTTDNEGSAELEFSSNPEDEEKPLPPALSSLANIKLVEIRTTDGKVVLMGAF